MFKSLLTLYSDASGTSINASKSQLFFFNTPPSTQRNISRILGFTISHLPSKYLGAPLSDSAIKHASWRSLLDKLESKLSSWTFHALNMAGRLILIKYFLQAMPLYLFSTMAAPKWVLKAIRNLQRSFLWGSSGRNRKWALVNWKEVCKIKSEGGLGLRDPLQSTSAKFWEDSWQQLPKLANIFQMPLWKSYIQQENLIQVQQFSQQTEHHGYRLWKPTSSWQRDWEGETDSDIEQELTHRRIRHSNQQDKLRRGHTHKGTFTTKEAHQLRFLDTQADKDQIWARVWLPRLWPKISTFLWLLSKKRILTWDNLIKRGFIGPSICPNCNLHAETISHLMETCPLAKQIWEKV
eukprot:PITA_15536